MHGRDVGPEDLVQVAHVVEQEHLDPRDLGLPKEAVADDGVGGLELLGDLVLPTFGRVAQ